MIPITEGSCPTLLSIHIKVSEFSPLNSLIKLIFMILTRGVAHSDQDPSFAVSQFLLHAPPRGTTHSYTQINSLPSTRLTASHTWKHPQERDWIFSRSQLGQVLQRFFHKVLCFGSLSALSRGSTELSTLSCPDKSTEPPDHTTKF